MKSLAWWALALLLSPRVGAEVDMNIGTCAPPTTNNISVEYTNRNPDPWDMRGYGFSVAAGNLRGKFAASPSGNNVFFNGQTAAPYFQTCNNQAGVPARRQLEAKIGTCNEPNPPKEPTPLQCGAVNPDYNAGTCVQDGLGINRGDGFGGFIDSYEGNTQIQVRLPPAWTRNGVSVRFDPTASMGGPFYMMAMVALQEYLYVDMQFMLALGGYLSGAGLVNASSGASLYTSPANTGPGTNPYGSFAVTYETNTKLIKDYPKYFSITSAAGLPSLVATNGAGPTTGNSPQQLNSGFLAALNLWWYFDGLKSAQDLCFKQYLEQARDKSAGLKLLLSGYNIGPNNIATVGPPASPMDDYATHVLPAGVVNPLALTDVDVTRHMKVFPYGAPAAGNPASPDYNNQNYIVKVFDALNPLVTAASNCASGGTVYDAGITLQDIKELFFGQGGTVAKQGNGGLLWHFNIAAAARQALWTDLDCAFNGLKGKAPGRGANEISYRYDLLSILRVARQHFSGFINKYNDRPTPSDAYSSDWSIWVGNHSRKPCNAASLVADSTWPVMSLAPAPGKGDRVVASATDNKGIKALEYSMDLTWRSWQATDANFTVPQTMAASQRMWFRATDSCGNSTIEEVKWLDSPPKVITPVATPNGRTFIGSIQVSLSTLTPGPVTICYTINGTDPDSTCSNATPYTGPITIAANTTLKARAIKSGYIASDIMTEVYAKAPKLDPPVATPPGQQFSNGTTLSVTLSTPGVTGTTIFYTLDGSTPGTAVGGSTLQFNPATPILISNTTTIKAIATKPNNEQSNVMTEVYERVDKVSKPVATPPGRSFTALDPDFTVTLTTPGTPGATIFYTLDGTTPGTAVGGSTLQYNPATPIPVTGSLTIKAIAVKAGLDNSDIMTEVYTETIPGKVATPVATPPGQNFFQSIQVSLSCATPGADILYTTDGTTPDTVVRGSTQRYTGPLTFTANTTLKAKAVKSGMYSSDMITEVYVSTPPVAIAKAWYKDLNGNGEIETALVDFGADLPLAPDSLTFQINDQRGVSASRTARKKDNEISLASGSRSRVEVKFLTNPFPFGMTSVTNRASSGQAYTQANIPMVAGAFPVDDSVAPVILQGKVFEPDSANPLKRIRLEYSEAVQAPAAYGNAVLFRSTAREYTPAEVTIASSAPAGAREVDLFIDTASLIFPIAGDSAALNVNGQIADNFGNAPAAKLYRKLDGDPPKAKPVEIFVTFPNGAKEKPSTGAEAPGRVADFIPIDRSGAALPGSGDGHCGNCPPQTNGSFLGPVVHIITPVALEYSFRIFTNTGDFVAEGKGKISKDDLLSLESRNTGGGIKYTARIVWTGWTQNGVKAGTGAYILQSVLKTDKDERSGAPPGREAKRIVFGLLRSFRGL